MARRAWRTSSTSSTPTAPAAEIADHLLKRTGRADGADDDTALVVVRVS